ncbi:glycosylphosphatidylinositol anchor biosynthesis [Dimargaris xerosporica]|nr:glycosylphosphatidylinositol anchor biosynthesis [Dimargaris xerosporica]
MHRPYASRSPNHTAPLRPSLSPTAKASPATKRPWRKLLYVKQDYPDNYVDESFLENLQKNVNFQSYDYGTLIQESTVITNHVSSVLVFVAVFIQLYHGRLDPHVLVSVGTLATAGGVMVWEWLLAAPRDPVAGTTQTHTDSVTLPTKPGGPTATAVPMASMRAPRLYHSSLVKTAAVFFLTLLGLSPILRTLTQDISSDSIWAMSVCLFLINILFHDYRTNLSHNIEFPGSVALNTAVFACVLLASRLSTNLHAFGFMSFALEWFALFPILRRNLKVIYPTWHLGLTVGMVAMTCVLFWPIARPLAILYLVAMFCLTFLCPLWLIWVQRYKNEIHGPWDEAQPKVHRYRGTYR